MAEEDNPSADEQQSPPPPTCRVALIGSQRQRVAKVTAIIHAKNNDTVLGLGCSVVDVSSLLTVPSSTTTTTSTTGGGDESLPLQLTPDPLLSLPKGVPSTVKIEILPCVATFDSYEDEHGATIRYLVSLEYHGPNGMLVKGKSLAPFFDEIDIDDTKNNKNNNNDGDSPFPGIAAVAIGAGIETTEDDVEKIKTFLNTLSSSCAAQHQQQQQTDNHDGKANEMLIECIQPNPEYTSMKEENEVFRQLSDEGKKEAVSNGTIGPGKMAKFVYNVAKRAVRQKWEKELGAYEQSFVQETKQEEEELTETQSEQQPAAAPVIHTPDSEKIRYACKRCRTILFGVDDLEDPPHVASQHDFRKRPNKAVYGNTGTCQNHCIAQPLPWMDNGCGGMEGKLHCPKCATKVGHYSWRGAQCSCGTWVTPAIMVPVSKVDEMKPMSQNVIPATGALYASHHPGMTMVQMPPVVGVNRGMGMINQQLGSMDIAGDYNLAGRPENTP